MARCIIHIGMHKTGSTSIQHSLRGFSDKRFVYAELGDEANHSLAMYSVFSANAERHHAHLAHRRDAAAVARYAARVKANLEAAIRAAEGRTLLISGEDISVLRRAEVVRIRAFLRPHFEDVSIVGYVRPPAGFIASSLQQRIRGGIREFLPREAYRNYERTFSKFDKVFGQHNVHLWKFDPSGFPSGCVVRDFCERLGIDLPPSRIIRMNESLSRTAVALLYTYRKLAPASAKTLTPPQALNLGKILQAAGAEKFRISPRVVEAILQENRDDVAWMENRLGSSLGESLGAELGSDVSTEADLLRHEPAVAAKLLALLGGRAPAGVTGATAQEIALLVDAVRQAHRSRADVASPEPQAPATPGAGPKDLEPASFKAADLLKRVRQSTPDLLEGIAGDEALALVEAVLAHIHQDICSTRDGTLSYAGLGRFRVRSVETETEGRKVNQTKITFRRSLAEEQARPPAPANSPTPRT